MNENEIGLNFSFYKPYLKDNIAFEVSLNLFNPEIWTFYTHFTLS